MATVAAPALVVPREQAQQSDGRSTDWIATLILYTPLLGVTIFAKLALVIGGSEIILGVPAILGALVLGILTGRLKPHPVRMAAYLGLASIMAGLEVFAAPTFITSSLMLVLAIPLAHAFTLNGAGEDAEVHLRRFRNFSIALCLLGIGQYLAQFVIGQRFAYPVEHFGPSGFISVTKTYNCLIPIRFGSGTLKSNGVFLLEPSYYSQMCAAGFAAEAAGPRRLLRLGILSAGFVVAYSGTGILMLAPALAVLVIAERRYEILAFLLIVAAAGAAFSKQLGLEVFLERAGEFNSTKSSGYMRYVGGFHLFEQYLWPYPKRALFGMGSGMMFRSTPWPKFYVAETGWVKMLIEFGLVGFITYFGYLFYSVFSTKQPLTLRACIAVTLVLSGILDPWSHALILSLLVWMPPLKALQPAAQPELQRPQVAAQAIPKAEPVVAPPVRTTQPGTGLARTRPPPQRRPTIRGQGPR
ncbi:MAG TPA: hypothetical protein VJR89_26030 [Polyangiales bacterium]|nr:hypothetical protein [Polyangiales bacterium]